MFCLSLGSNVAQTSDCVKKKVPLKPTPKSTNDQKTLRIDAFYVRLIIMNPVTCSFVAVQRLVWLSEVKKFDNNKRYLKNTT